MRRTTESEKCASDIAAIWPDQPDCDRNNFEGSSREVLGRKKSAEERYQVYVVRNFNVNIDHDRQSLFIL